MENENKDVVITGDFNCDLLSTKKCKTDYFNTKFKNCKNSKECWQTINKLLNKWWLGLIKGWWFTVYYGRTYIFCSRVFTVFLSLI